MKDIGETPVSFEQTAEQLHANGYRPVLLDSGTKKPSQPGWNIFNTRPWTDQELRNAITLHGDAACGLAITDTLFALDADILDAEVAAQVASLADECFGETPLLRYGRRPKFVKLYRQDGTVVGSKPFPVECYSRTGQVVAFGIHEKTGRPYEWPHESPLTKTADDADIPIVTGIAVQKFLRDCQPLIAPLRKAGGRGAQGLGRDAGDAIRRYMRGNPKRWPRAAKNALCGAVEGGRHFAVRAVIGTGQNAGYTYDQIVDHLYRVAPQNLLEYVGDDYITRTLDYMFRAAGVRRKA